MSSHSERYYIEVADYFDRSIRIGIFKRNYTGASEEIFVGSDGVKIEWNGNTDNFIEQPIVGSRLVLDLVNETNFKYIELYSNNNREYYAVVERDSEELFRGYIVANIFSEPYKAPPYLTQVSFVDGLSNLKNVDYILDETTVYYPTIGVIQYLLNETGFDLNVKEGINIFPFNVTDRPYQDGRYSALIETYINPSMYTEMNCYEVLEDILRAFDAKIFQYNGNWWILRNSDLRAETVMVRTINSNWIVTNYEDLNLETPIAVSDNNNKFARYDQQLRFNPSWKQFKILHETGYKDNLVLNGDFSSWSQRTVSQNPLFKTYAPDLWSISPDTGLLRYNYNDISAVGVPNTKDLNDIRYIEQSLGTFEASVNQRIRLEFEWAVYNNSDDFDDLADKFSNMRLRLQVGGKYLGKTFGSYQWFDDPVDISSGEVAILQDGDLEFAKFWLIVKSNEIVAGDAILTLYGTGTSTTDYELVDYILYQNANLTIYQTDEDNNTFKYDDEYEIGYNVDLENTYRPSDFEIMLGDAPLNNEVQNTEVIYNNQLYFLNKSIENWYDQDGNEKGFLLSNLADNLRDRHALPQWLLSGSIITKNLYPAKCIIDYLINTKKYATVNGYLNLVSCIFSGDFLEIGEYSGAEWILEDGAWDDENIWIDDETWKDN